MHDPVAIRRLVDMHDDGFPVAWPPNLDTLTARELCEKAERVWKAGLADRPHDIAASDVPRNVSR